MVGRPRGELAELENVLSALQKSDRNRPEIRASKRQAFQKMIGYMTIGMDMSGLMPRVISAANLSPDDVVLKKMMYLYICTYARQNPDLTLMAINQLQKDCNDTDPSVRGLALRSLCSLRVANLLEYVVDPILAGLKDRHPYVQRTAVMGVLKVYHMDPSVAHNRGLIGEVRALLGVKDVEVVGNCLAVMMSIEGPSKLTNKTMIYNLLNRLKEFSEWHQCQILELVANYRVSGEEEVFDIMNVLEDRMTSTNSALVMAVIKVFLFLTISMPATHQQVLDRIREPLRMIVSRENPAVTYTVLCHALLVAQRAPIMFAQDYMNFYCRTDDPMYIKKLKLSILTAIADNSNAYEIVSECTEYIRDINPVFAREALKAVGRIALSVPDVGGIIERLIAFLEFGDAEVLSETLVQMKDLLRRYPDMAEVCLPAINEISPSKLDHPEAKAAFIWILGQHGDKIQDAPYLLERMAEAYSDEEATVRLALLSGAAKLFFMRPPECQKLLGTLLAAGVADEDQDVHDRALLYYRLLSHNVSEAEKVIRPTLPTVSDFAEEMSEEIRDKIFDEFNTLSVVYQKPAGTFVEVENVKYHEDVLEEELQEAPAPPTENTNALLADQQQEADLLDLSAGTPAPPEPSKAAAQDRGLVDIDDLLGDLSTGGLAQGPPAAPAAPEISLVPQAKLSPADFQTWWRQFPFAAQYSEPLTPSKVSAIPRNSHKDFCQHMKAANIQTMASGGDPSLYRYYFYAQQSGTNAWYLVEVLVSNQEARVAIRCQSPAASQPFVDKWKSLFSQFR
eukprot:evm.model.scf_696.5 EVM.evm.TU.scf_696.5   scf_696:47608-59307(+)